MTRKRSTSPVVE